MPIFTKILASSLKHNGHFICLWDPTFSEDYPYHIGAKADIEALLKEYGLTKVNDFVYIRSRSLRTLMRHLFYECGRELRFGFKMVLAGIKEPHKSMEYIFKKIKW